MTTSSSGFTITDTNHDARQTPPHGSLAAPQFMIQQIILDLSLMINHQAALLAASSNDPLQGSDDLAALAWIQRSLEDIEATIFSLSATKRPHSAAFEGSGPSSAMNREPKFR